MYDPNIACISGLTIAPLFFFKVSRPFLNHSRDIRSSPSRSVINLPLALEIAKFRLSAGFPKDDLKITIFLFFFRELATRIVSLSGLSKLNIISYFFSGISSRALSIDNTLLCK